MNEARVSGEGEVSSTGIDARSYLYEGVVTSLVGTLKSFDHA